MVEAWCVVPRFAPCCGICAPLGRTWCQRTRSIKLASPLTVLFCCCTVLYARLMDDSDADQREEHRQEPNVPVTLEQLAEIGVLYWKLDADKYEDDPALEAIREERGYSYQVRAVLQCVWRGGAVGVVATRRGWRVGGCAAVALRM